MLKLQIAPEPATFHAQVRQPGMRALEEFCGVASGRPGPKRKVLADRIKNLPLSTPLTDYWTDCIGDLYTAYRGICAYSAHKIHRIGNPQVDHYRTKSKVHPALAYEWCNYRLCSPLMNSRKREFADVLDPAQIGHGWFCIDFSDLSVQPAAHLDPSTRQRVQATIDRLDLNDQSLCQQDRVEYYQSYAPSPDPVTGERPDPLSFELLAKSAPFLASELLRQPIYLRPDDRARLSSLRERHRSLIAER